MMHKSGDKKFVRSSVMVFAGTFLLMLSVTALAGVPNFFNVRDYGAVGNGKVLDTKTINRAVENCSKTGGGTVYFPAGTYLSGSIELKSDVSLYLDSGARLLAAPNELEVYDYDPYPYNEFQDFGHSHWHNALIWGEKVENVAIMGTGVIDGTGMTRGDPPPGGGDKTISLKLCKNVLIKDVTVVWAGHFAILATGIDNMVIDSVKIDTNRDGINLDCCRDVRVSNCSINSPRDDGLCPKSSYALGFIRASENITITNCSVSGYDVGSLIDGSFTGGGGTGRIKFGTESNGGFKNIVIDNIIFDRCQGLALEEVDGGVLENISISNIVMNNVSKDPIFIRLGNRARGPYSPPPGEIKNINISDLTVNCINPDVTSTISGIPGQPIENVRLSNIRIKYIGGGTKKDSQIVPPERESEYPEPHMFGILPAYGFYARHVKGLEFHDVKVEFEREDLRPAFVFRDVQDIVLDRVEAERAAKGEPPVVFREGVHNVTVYNSRTIKATESVCKGAKLSKEKVLANEPFMVQAEVSAEKAGISEIKLLVDGKVVATKPVWFEGGESEEVTFPDVRLYAPGEHEVKAGDSGGKIIVGLVEGKFAYTGLEAVTPVVKRGKKIDSSTVLVAEQSSVIRIAVKNVGSSELTDEVVLEVNKGKVASKKLTLEPGENKPVEFQYVFPRSGYYTVTVGNLSQKVYVWQKPGKFVCKKLTVSRGEAGEPFTVTATITDTEYHAHFYGTEGSRVDLYVDGKWVDWAFVMVKKNEEKKVSFKIALEPGKHTITVGNCTREITV